MEVKRPIVCALFFGFTFLITMIVLITYFSTKRSSASSALRSPVNSSSSSRSTPLYPLRPRPTTPRDYERVTPYYSRRPTEAQQSTDSPARNDPIRNLSEEERRQFLSKYQDDPLYKDVTEMLHRQERRASICLHRGKFRIVKELVPSGDLFYESLVPSQRVCLPTCNMSDGLHGKACETVRTEPTTIAVYLYGNPNSVHPKTVPLSFEGENLVVGYMVEVDAETVCRCLE